jgi:hypothetical protein
MTRKKLRVQWSFNTSTNKIAPQWINTDFTAPTTHIVFKPSEGKLAEAIWIDPDELTDTGMIYLTANPGSISGTTKIVVNVSIYAVSTTQLMRQTLALEV